VQLAADFNDTSAFKRAVAFPRRGVGEQTVKALANYASQKGVSIVVACQRAIKGENIAGVQNSVYKALGPFVHALLKFKAACSDEAASVATALRSLIREVKIPEFIQVCVCL
jgi:superfamily I DNA/RNA helicase